MAEVLKHYASLHMHSSHSDGVYSPKELVEVGCAEGYRALALTDHDTVTGNREVMEECRKALELAKKYDLYVSGGADHEGLLGGEYARYEHPEKTIYWVPELSVGTTEFFFNEIKDMKKSPERQRVFDEMLADESIWITSGSYRESRDKYEI